MNNDLLVGLSVFIVAKCEFQRNRSDKHTELPSAIQSPRSTHHLRFIFMKNSCSRIFKIAKFTSFLFFKFSRKKTKNQWEFTMYKKFEYKFRYKLLDINKFRNVREYTWSGNHAELRFHNYNKDNEMKKYIPVKYRTNTWGKGGNPRTLEKFWNSTLNVQ